MSDTPVTRLVCAGCDAEVGGALPFRCPNADATGAVDHVVARVLDASRVEFPRAGDPNPFVRYRGLFHTYHAARAGGLADAEIVDCVAALDARVAAVDGRGFMETPFDVNAALASAIGLDGARLWIKDETGNVSGTHKARHLMAIAVHLDVAERVGWIDRDETDRRGLAIASCGNAAMAAAILARAAGRPLRVFIPEDAAPDVVGRLRVLGADTVLCGRNVGERGDPTYLAFRRATSDGAIPFCCQGNENGMNVEGGATVGHEVAAALAARDATLDRLFVQVGGGALASGTVLGLRDAAALGALERLPRVHTVQTTGAHPLRRAYVGVRRLILEGLAPGAPRSAPEPADGSPSTAEQITADEAAAAFIHARLDAPAVARAFATARVRRTEFMWPWERTPHSIARGILDDETYDWFAVVRGMIETGGYPIVVSEADLAAANDKARRATGLDVDPTGTAGLAGLDAVARAVTLGGGGDIGVLFTGTGHGGARGG